MLFDPFSPVIRKNKKKKKTTLDGHISETRTNLKSKLRLSESSFNFSQNSVIFCAFYLHGYTAGDSAFYNLRRRSKRLTGLKSLKVLSVFLQTLLAFSDTLIDDSGCLNNSRNSKILHYPLAFVSHVGSPHCRNTLLLALRAFYCSLCLLDVFALHSRRQYTDGRLLAKKSLKNIIF